jgi:hypothetical protein
MRTENKYDRNRRFRNKAWKRIKVMSAPYETFCPYQIDGAPHSWLIRRWDTEEQIKHHFEWIDKQARAIDKGTHKHWNHASASFRRELNKQRRAAERHALARINMGDVDYEMPRFKRAADWLYF